MSDDDDDECEDAFCVAHRVRHGPNVSEFLDTQRQTA